MFDGSVYFDVFIQYFLFLVVYYKHIMYKILREVLKKIRYDNNWTDFVLLM